MWYIFPQIKGLGSSAMSRYYAIENITEAQAYLANELLYNHLISISQALLNLKTNNILEVMEYPDDQKLQSSITLFIMAKQTALHFKKYLTNSIMVKWITKH